MTMPTPAQLASESRREFLKTGGALIVTFAVGGIGDAAAQAVPAKTVAADQVDGFLAIDAKGNVTVFSGNQWITFKTQQGLPPTGLKED